MVQTQAASKEFQAHGWITLNNDQAGARLTLTQTSCAGT